jgi:hypothetical protein
MSLLHRDARREALLELSRFRGEFHSCLTARSDALFELADAVPVRKTDAATSKNKKSTTPRPRRTG